MNGEGRASAPDVSVIVPCYNDSSGIEAIHEGIERAFAGTPLRWELILVNDGSSDDTYEAILRLHERRPHRVVAVDLARNHGQHLAICAGFHVARGRWIATCDSDLHVSPRHLPDLIGEAGRTGAEVVVGVRMGRDLESARSWGSRLFNRLHRHLFGGRFRDVGSMFRVYSPRAVRTLLHSGTKKQYLPAAAVWSGMRIVETEVPCESGSIRRPSHYSFWRLVRMTLDLFFEYTELPLKISAVIGVGMVGLGLSGFVALAWYRIFVGPGVSGLALLIAGIFLLIGLQFVLLGVIAYYVFRVFSRPLEPGYWIADVRGASRDRRPERSFPGSPGIP